MNQRINKSLTESRLYRSERGVALIMVLGILSLLIVLALSFTFATINSQKSVNIAQDLVKSRLHAESGFKEAFAFLSEEFTDPNIPENIFVYDF